MVFENEGWSQKIKTTGHLDSPEAIRVLKWFRY